MQRDAITMRKDRLRVVAVADTHGRPNPEAAKRIAALEPDAILHGGDIGDLAVLDALAQIAPVYAVRGNIDVKVREVPSSRVIDLVDDDGTLSTLYMVHIAVYGPKLRADVAKAATAEGAELVVCGHSHVPFIGRDRGLAVFNPGSIGPRRFQLPIVFGVIDVSRERIALEHRDALTGEKWPPSRPS